MNELTSMESIAMALSQCLNALGLIASPRAWQNAVAGGARQDLRDGIIRSLNAARQALEPLSAPAEKAVDEHFITGTTDLEALQKDVSILLDFLEHWSDGPAPDRAVTLARQCLAHLGIPEPGGGWDRFKLDELS